MFLFTKTAVIKSDLQRIILLLMCFTVYLSNTYSCIFSANLYLLYTLYIGHMHKLNDWFCGSIL